ncbi:CYTH domain-containing protein [Betaproteobacteria bacterium]|nr:CYTH domain-containing protein [Betaproteobacteria bacterium]GHU48190.1 CYTH domain-containing protein [Betaproteobacteria bacterium]
MAEEIEIKLALPVRLAPGLRQLPLLAGAASQKHCLRNLYLDTPEQDLRGQRMALRRRQMDDLWLMTIKTEGEVRAGYSRRQEWEYPMPPDELTFDAIDDDTLRQQLQRLAPRLTLAFRTDFVRQCWHLHYGKSQIELALDLGRICTRKHREPIREVELELKSGTESDLHTLADTLLHTLPGLTPHAPSKAARGYALLDKS